MGKKAKHGNRSSGLVRPAGKPGKPPGPSNSAGIGKLKKKKPRFDAKASGRKSSKPQQHVRMANPNFNKRGRNKRHGNADLSDDDSLPSESDVDSDEDFPEDKRDSQGENDASDSDVEQFLKEDDSEPEEDLKVEKISKKPVKKKKNAELSEDEDSDGSDDAEDEEEPGERLSLKTISEWEKSLQDKPSPPTLKTVIRGFLAAVRQLAGQKDQSKKIVVDSSAFNAIVSLCLRHLGSSLSRLFSLNKNSKPTEKISQLKKNKKWKLLHVPIRSYLSALTELLTRLHEEGIVRRVLKHIMELLPYFSCNPKASKMLIKHTIQLWSSGSDNLRVTAFLTISRFLRMNSEEWVLPVIKKMYVAYVTNCKETTTSTWPMISFMASSLVEILKIRPEITYQQAFIYIRQMAIHVRNATNQKNKESQAKVYNWPFMHCIYLWSKLIADVHPNQILSPLLHPLVQVVTSTISVNPVKKFYPLMFHCVRALNIISAKTNIFVPVIPIIFSALQVNDFNKKPKSTSFKPFEMMCILKFSDSQLIETNYRTSIADQIYELTLEYLKTQCCKIAFPELVVMPAVQLRRFLKECKMLEVSKKFKHLLNLMESQSTFITERRKHIQFKFNDTSAVESWEKELEGAHSPLQKFYIDWKSSKKTLDETVNAALEGKYSKKVKSVGDEMDEEDMENEDEDIWSKTAATQEEPQSQEEVNDEAGDIVEQLGDLSDEDEGGEDESSGSED